mmetsp:Transcript_116876/g.342250  ORF Transcript_116876/g.342250 Transcript_116876/m.342250 type:complete len:539 (+) Transcript_116876:119-1735(+)
MSVPTVPDRNVLAGRIQGFGNVNPPALEEETGTTVAKRAVGRLGDMVGEEVMLTVEDFKEKGAVGAVKDAVADAGDILIDGVSGIIGWIRGDAPPEEESEKTEDATKALSNGPSGAAYGISQASPTGGINAVWVMPEEADPSALAQLASQQGSLVHQQADPRVPKNIQPYQPTPSRPGFQPQIPTQSPMQLPGGPMIAPYQAAPSGPGARPPPFVPGANLTPGIQQSRWGPGGYNPAAMPGGAGSSGSASSAPTGAKGLVERIAKGDVIVGPDVAKRLVSQCVAAKMTAKQLSETVCERTRRLYLGLDGGDQSDADAALGRLLGLVDALAQQDGDLAKSTALDVKKSVHEEFLSLRSSAKHKDAAEPMLRRLGLIGKAADATDLLGGGGGSAPAPAASAPAQTADLLGGAPAPAASADLLGTDSGVGSLIAPAPAPVVTGGVALDPLAPATSPAGLGNGSLLGGLAGLDVPASAPSLTGPVSPLSMAAGGSTSQGSAALPMGGAGASALAAFSMPKPQKKDEDAFGFVGAEMSKASKP